MVISKGTLNEAWKGIGYTNARNHKYKNKTEIFRTVISEVLFFYAGNSVFL